MGAEFFDQLAVEPALQFVSKGLEIRAFSIHAQAILVEAKGEDQNLLGSSGGRFGACLADVIHTYGSAGRKKESQPRQNKVHRPVG